MNFVALTPFRKRRSAVAALGPEAWGVGRRLAVLLAPVIAGLVVGFDPGRLVWAWLGLAIVGLELAGHATRPGGAPVPRQASRRWRRQLRRRRIINRRRRVYAQRRQARAVRDARDRRRRRRRVGRRRRVQARFIPADGLEPSEAMPIDLTETPEVAPAIPFDLTRPPEPEPAIALDLAGPAAPEPAIAVRLADPPGARPPIEIDLTDQAVYGSEITLESGDILESGVVGPCIELSPVSDVERHD